MPPLTIEIKEVSGGVYSVSNDDKSTAVFIGSLADCWAFIKLREHGYIKF